MRGRLRTVANSAQDSATPAVIKHVKTTYWKTILPVAALVALCGCGPSYTFSPWVGEQQNWVTGNGSYVKMVKGAQLFPPGEYPNRSYIIIGKVETDSEDNVAKAVKEQHADAALLLSERTVRNGSVAVMGGGVLWSEPLRKTVITANLVKYR